MRSRPESYPLAFRKSHLFAPATETVTAVDRVSFSISPGERVAFIGPNGAGKSTTLKVLSGILFPDAGRVEVLGMSPFRDRRRLGFKVGTVFGQRSQLWYRLPARDTFRLLARVYELEHLASRDRLSELVQAFGLAELLDRPVRQLSLGERMRCEIAASLIHRGRVLSDGPIAELRRRYLHRRRITFVGDVPELSFSTPGVSVVRQELHQTTVKVELDRVPMGLVIDAALKQGELRDLRIEDPPLDEVIRAMYVHADGSSPRDSA